MILLFYMLLGDCSWKGLHVEWSVRVKFDKRDLEGELSFCHWIHHRDSAENLCALTTVPDTEVNDELSAFHGNNAPLIAAFQRKIYTQVLATTAGRTRQVSPLLLRHTQGPYLNRRARLITNHYLWDLAATSYCPSTWDTRKLWHPRMVYTCIRDSIELEKSIMSICPEWRRASEYPFLLFWVEITPVILLGIVIYLFQT